ncbi:MAG TPA: MBL fold metallo-hydrolase [Candidatus Saccharimonadales bacterium]
MDIQFYGANCLTFSYKNTRVVIDDNLAELGKKSITKAEDIALYTSNSPEKKTARLTFDGPGEYEVGTMSVMGIEAKPFINDDSGDVVTMFKIFNNEISVLVTGHILGELTASQLEKVGAIDVLFVPVGNGGYTLDPIGAQKLIRDIEPKIVVPTHYKESGLNYPVPQGALDAAIKELAMEPKETLAKLKLKPIDLTDVTQLVILETS